ncbi:MAG: 16S rRNA (guanine(966)-N(2))-methyltransferase RsmD [Vampirovibrionales bacterium]|nr:16S rRNA (guanine(966)-N(2))-methyltransferase RsmD [Vampirovibrionales bacterium]
MIQISGGQWRGRQLSGFPKSLSPKAGFRPTTGRVKEALFSMLAPELSGARVLDGFAGSGALGFEALSRGASFVMAIEPNPVAITLLKSNAEKLALNPLQWQLFSGSLEAFLAKSATHEPFDVILLDPPYERPLNQDLLHALIQPPWACLHHRRVVIEQASQPAVNATLLSAMGFQPRAYGSTTLWLL